jgi:beta-1,4-mannosyltransferase
MPIEKLAPLRAVFFPALSTLSGNPYWSGLAEALAIQGVQVEDPLSAYFGARWLWANRRDYRVLHFHYIQQFYAYEANYARLGWVLRFARNLLLARLLGYRTVFTLHNLEPTYPLEPAWVDYLGHWAIANLTGRVIVHCEAARQALAARYGRRSGVSVIPHPSFIGRYPNDISRQQAHASLSLTDEDFVFLFFGGLRPNKGIESLIQAFRRLEGGRLRLVIAGDPGQNQAYLQELQGRRQSDPRIRFTPQWVADEQVQEFMNAADVVVLPFARITTSSSAILAMSFSRPVIVPRLGCLPELVGENTGFLYNPMDGEGLFIALQESLTADLPAMGLNAYQSIEEFTWQNMAEQTLLAYG